ncbi:MAG TPA: hypothetical protein VIN38_01995 [Thiobacillus sp.]
MNRKSGFWIGLWVVLTIVTGFLAFGTGIGSTGYGMWNVSGPMNGWNDSLRMNRYGGGYGMGAGMMGGMSSGMMGQVGPGGMHGMGMGYGTMGGDYPGMQNQLPGLTSEQSHKLSQLQQEAQARNSTLAQQLWTAQDKLNLLQMHEKRDWNAIRAASQQVFELQRQQHDAAIDMQQKVDGLLTDSQRQEMARSWRGEGWTGAQ